MGHKMTGNPMFTDQVKSWIDGLEPRAVTRDLDWELVSRLKVPEGEKNYTCGFEVPIGYILGYKEWALREGKKLEPYWKDQDTETGSFYRSQRDNIVFIIFLDVKTEGSYILPDNVPASRFLNLEVINWLHF
jgi:methionyl-tRNA synthetase